MSLVSLVYMIFILIIYLLLYTILGSGFTFLLVAFILLVQAILFTIRPMFYDRYLSLINPKMYDVLIKKAEDFIKKRRKANIVGLYIISILMGFNGTLQLVLGSNKSNAFLSSFKDIIVFAVATVCIAALLMVLSTISIKKSKTASEDFAWNILIGVGVSALIIGGLLFYFFVII